METPTEALIEAVEEASNTAVEIAHIEAETRVEIATINAAVEVAHIEAQQYTNEEIENWRSLSMSLETSLAEARARIAELETPSEPSISEAEMLEAEAIAETLTPSEQSLTPPSISQEIESTAMEAIVKEEGGNLELGNLPPALTVPKRGPIIRLV